MLGVWDAVVSVEELFGLDAVSCSCEGACSDEVPSEVPPDTVISLEVGLKFA